jgi:D-amino peptidase
MTTNEIERVFVSADMEGTSGLERLEEIFRGLPGYDRFRRMMAGDVNAAVQGLFDAGVDEVLVADSHGYMKNLPPEAVHPEAYLKRGMRRNLCQMKGFDPTFDAVVLSGYHARAGTDDAILSHTWIPEFQDVRVNGQSVGEPSLNAYLAGAYGVPILMLSGCDRTIAQARDEALGEEVAYARTKDSLGYFDGDHRPLAESRPLLRQTAERAITDATYHAPVRAELPVTIEVDIAAEPFSSAEQNARWMIPHRGDVTYTDAELVMEFVDGIERAGETIRFTRDNFPDAYRKLHEILLQIYERGIENLVDNVADPGAYDRPDLGDIVGDHPVTEIETEPRP